MIALRLALALAAALIAGAARAEECPAPPDHGARIDALLAEAREAPTEGAAREIAGRMWELWAEAPNEQAQAVLLRRFCAAAQPGPVRAGIHRRSSAGAVRRRDSSGGLPGATIRLVATGLPATSLVTFGNGGGGVVIRP